MSDDTPSLKPASDYARSARVEITAARFEVVDALRTLAVVNDVNPVEAFKGSRVDEVFRKLYGAALRNAAEALDDLIEEMDR